MVQQASALDEARIARLEMNLPREASHRFQTEAFSVVSLSHNPFAMAEAAISTRLKQVEKREREIGDAGRKVESILSELEWRKKRLENEEKLVGERIKDVELREKGVKEYYEVIKVENMAVKERWQALEVKAKRVVEMESRGVRVKTCDRCKGVAAEEQKKIDDRGRVLKLREEEVVHCFKVVEEREQEIAERGRVLEVREKRLDERWQELAKSEERFSDECRGLELRETALREREKALDLKEERLREESQRLELEEKEANQNSLTCRKALEMEQEQLALKQARINERDKELALREIEITDQLKGLDSVRREVDERLHTVELRKKEITQSFEALELRMKEVEDRLLAVQLKEEELSDGLQALNFKEKQLHDEFNELYRSLELKETDLNGRVSGIELMKNEVGERLQQVESKEKKTIQGLRALELKEEEVNERLRAVQLRKKEMDEVLMAFELKQKDVNEGLRVLELKKKESDGFARASELEEKEINGSLRTLLRGLEKKNMEADGRCQALALKEKQLIELQERVNLKERTLEKCHQAVERGKKQMYVNFEALMLTMTQMEQRFKITEQKHLQLVESAEKLLSDSCEALEMKASEIADCCREMELKEKQLAEHFQAINVKEKQLIRRRKVLDWKLQQIIERCLALEFKEKQINEQNEALELEEKLISEQRAAFELKVEQTDEQYQIQESKENLAEDLEINHDNYLFLEAKAEESVETSTSVDAMKQTQQGCKELDFSEKPMAGELRAEPLQTTDVIASSLPGNIRKLCTHMDVAGLRSYLIEHVKEYGIWQKEMLDSLCLASDPAKLVLEVIRSFHKSGINSIQGDECQSGCIYLLAHMTRLQPDIKACVKNEAKQFAAIWRECMGKHISPPEVLCFLQFLVSYKLAGSYDADILLSLFENFYSESEAHWPHRSPKVCHALGLSKNNLGHIQSLVMENKRLHAVIYICALQMEDHYPPEFLLKVHMEYIQKSVHKMVAEGSNTAKVGAASMELSALKAIVKCISHFKLASRYSPMSLQMRIKQLEKDIGEKNTEENRLMNTSGLKLGKKRVEAHDSVVTESCTSDPFCDTVSGSYGCNKRSGSSSTSTRQEKRTRLDARGSLIYHNTSVSSWTG